MVTRELEERLRRDGRSFRMGERAIEYPYGKPEDLLREISRVTKEWEDGRISHEGSMSRIHTILKQVRRV